MANDPINPNYYQFPSGAETIDITQFLTGNGAQATQYIVRSTRFDKEIKGNPIEDLTKAIWFCEKEIERLEDIESEEFVKAVNPGQHIDHSKLVKNALNHEVISSDEDAPVPRVEVRDDATELVTVEDARGIASDGLDLDGAASEVGNADAKHVGIVRAAKVMASNPGLYI